MGVHGLWELLAPVGRRVSVETLAGKTLAVDASIWMVQFMKAMRNEKGEMVRNAHLLGFFRRICKLLFLRTKPVFVFDGGTPALKRRTVIARRRQRENAQAKVRKTAEKLLFNHLKTLRLKELADDIKNQRLKQKSDTKGPKEPDQLKSIDSDLGISDVKDQNEISAAKFAATEERDILQAKRSRSQNQEELDEMLAASIVAEENGLLARKDVASTVVNTSDDNCDADEEMILLSSHADVDLAVLAALPQSMQFDILAQLKGKKTEAPVKDVENQKQLKDKGKGVLLFTETDMSGCSSRCDNVTSSHKNQDKIDEMLAACIAEEENAKSLNNASTSLGASTFEEEDGDYDEDEEMILPAMDGEVDPAILASLPPSMQLDLLVQMRERLIAENRQKYQKVKKDPAKFSELQIQAYLKTVAFRREIDEVQKAAAGRGVGGVQTSRIASEANREYIFSSSFTGDKQELTSTRMEKNDDTHQKARGTHPLENFANIIAVGNDSNPSSGLVCNEPSESVDESIQTYLDERGRFRVSRLRALGMRMTRDIQRNLDLMKEIEQQKTYVNKAANIDTVLNAENSGPSESSWTKLVSRTQEMNVDSVHESVQNDHSILDRDTFIEISFEYDSKNMITDGEDDIFASLVGGSSQTILYANATAAKEKHSDSDCDWVEGVVECQDTIVPKDKVECKSSAAEQDNNDESEVEWEEGDCSGAKNTLCHPYESARKTSQGHLEEESNLQEALRRSLESIGDGEHKCMPSIDGDSNAKNKLDHGLVLGDDLAFSGSMDLNDKDVFLTNKNSMGGSTLHREESIEQNKLHENLDGDGRHDNLARNITQTCHFPESQSKSYMASTSNNLGILIDKPCLQDRCAYSEYSTSDTNVMIKDNVDMDAEQLFDKHYDNAKEFFDGNNSSKVVPLAATGEEKTSDHYESEPLSNSADNTKTAIPLFETSMKASTENLDNDPKFAEVDSVGNFSRGRSSNLAKDAVNTSGDFAAHVAEVDLDEEMRKLGQEYISLESEQRKFERNAESVNSELFTECQELLQMFGLPYIIAPMEAEAQCAFLEHIKLVDGVVTDDSDVFLFGARSVYKNIFDDRKYVETYFMEDIEKELGLTREKLIRMALLLGSDYTEGVSGIGIVNAIEVVNAFPEDDGLLKFRQWVESPDPTILGRLNPNSESNTRRKGSKVDEKINESNHNIEEPVPDQITNQQEQRASPDYNQEIKQTFIEKHRNVSKNWHIPSSFPSDMVISAYYSPQVDKSTDHFTWGKPDHLVLRKLCWEKFGWTSQKADELLLPVLKEYNKRETQLRLEAFYSFNERFAKIRSKRIKKAVKGITGKQPSELMDDSRSSKSGRGSLVEPGDNNLENLKGQEESLEGRKKPEVKQSRKRKNEGDTVDTALSMRKKIADDPSLDPSTSGVENSQPSKQTEKDQCDGKVLIGNRSSRGRGRGQGRGRGLGVKQGREKESFISQSYESSSGSSDADDCGPRVLVDVPKVPQEVRRSIRSRKPVNYFEKNEVEDANDFDQHNQKSLSEEAIEENSSYIHGARGDVATDLSRDEESHVIHSPPNDNRPKHHLDSESWFCTDAGEASHPDITSSAGISEDYLKLGGGFCLDDTDDHNENDGGDNATVDDSEDYPHCSVMLNETDRDKNSSDILFSGAEKADNEMQEGGPACEVDKEPNLQNPSYDQSEMEVLALKNADHNSESYTGAFRAMPFLRKRKKN